MPAHTVDAAPADPWTGWSFYGRYAAHESPELEADCERRLERLSEPAREQELRAETTDACAFARLMRLLVDRERVGDLRALALAGDDRARVTLMELLSRRGAEYELRREAELTPTAGFWLAALLSRQDRPDEALVVLKALGDHPGHRRAEHSQTMSVLASAGRIDELRRLSASGDRAAGRVFNDWLIEHRRVGELRERAAAGNNQALWRLAQLFADEGDLDAAIAELQMDADQGNSQALELIKEFQARQDHLQV